jgi:hypothetical protein
VTVPSNRPSSARTGRLTAKSKIDKSAASFPNRKTTMKHWREDSFDWHFMLAG